MVVTAPVLPVSGDVNNNGQVIVPETGGIVVAPPGGNDGPIDSYGAPVGPLVVNPDGNNRSPAVNPFVRPPFNPRNSFVQYINQNHSECVRLVVWTLSSK